MAKTDWEVLHKQLEDCAVKGDHAAARRILKSSNLKMIPRPLAPVIGEIAFRVNRPVYALKILQPLVYPESPTATPATNKEKTIYATGLASLGVIDEATSILDQVDERQEPEALFHRASVHHYNWNCAAAVPLLKKFIKSPSISDYRKLVGRVNLASDYIQIFDLKNASLLLQEIKAECEDNGFQLLLGNCHELLAQVEIFRGDTGQALFHLGEAKKNLENQSGLYSLWVEKWEALCHREVEAFPRLREKARAIGHWNTLRDLDLYEAILTKNEELFSKVILGSPSPHYRKRARQLFGQNLSSIGRQWLPINGGSPSDLKFDPYQATTHSEALHTKPTLLKLYGALVMDFYQPCTIGFLFQQIYRGEKFNPYTSPARVIRLLRRLNQWFKLQGWPLKIEFKKSEFRLASNQPVSVLVYRGETLSVEKGQVFQLRSHFHGVNFSVSDAAQFMECSESKTRKILSQAFERKLIVKDRGPKGIIYRFTSIRGKRAA